MMIPIVTDIWLNVTAYDSFDTKDPKWVVSKIYRLNIGSFFDLSRNSWNMFTRHLVIKIHNKKIHNVFSLKI